MRVPVGVLGAKGVGWACHLLVAGQREGQAGARDQEEVWGCGSSRFLLGDLEPARLLGWGADLSLRSRGVSCGCRSVFPYTVSHRRGAAPMVSLGELHISDVDGSIFCLVSVASGIPGALFSVCFLAP